MKSALVLVLTLASLNTLAAVKKMSCAVSENNELVSTIGVELNAYVSQVQLATINELTIFVNDVPNSNMFSLKMIGAELGLMVEATSFFGPNGEGVSTSVLNRGFTTSVTCLPVK